jgi:hypothetical protein
LVFKHLAFHFLDLELKSVHLRLSVFEWHSQHVVLELQPLDLVFVDADLFLVDVLYRLDCVLKFFCVELQELILSTELRVEFELLLVQLAEFLELLVLQINNVFVPFAQVHHVLVFDLQFFDSILENIVLTLYLLRFLHFVFGNLFLCREPLPHHKILLLELDLKL